MNEYVLVTITNSAATAVSANSTRNSTENSKSAETNAVEVAKRKPSASLTEHETDEDSTSAPGSNKFEC